MKVYNYKIQVRFRDCDSLGHINNAVYHSYVETCRTHWLDDALGTGIFSQAEKIPFILARTEIDYLSQGHLNHDIVVASWLSHIGQKSFHQVYEIKHNAKVLARAKAILVWFDFEKQLSIEIPETKRSLMKEYLLKEL